MNHNPSDNAKGGRYPVEQVSWDDAMLFCEKLTEKEHSDDRLKGWEFTLPTEAQWEYACRAGTNTDYSFGNIVNKYTVNYDDDGTWRARRREKDTTREVGSYNANAWGLYDMHGNVWEWCRDSCEYKFISPFYGIVITDTYKEDIEVDPWCRTGSCRVYRGGSWGDGEKDCRSARRYGMEPTDYHHTRGFRVVLVPVQE